MRQRVTILGVAIDDIRMDDALAAITRFIAEGGPHQIVTVNPEFVMEARRNSAFRRVLAAADLATPDGTGLLLASRWRGTPLRERVTGIALSERIAAAAARCGWSLFLLGAAPGVAERAAAALQQANPGLRIAGCYAGSPRAAEEPAIRARIAAAQPDILLVAYGHPTQELWIARNQPLLRVPVAIGVGGTFDELAGVVPRTPALVQRAGLKWLYRLVMQPWRWRRIMTAVPLFLWTVLREGRAFNPLHAEE
ncbi:MAG: WecB/TagA/CpsF family glycosyltransferase [Chloroflexi bacterium]|nr:WecB/TagA/CpsF family glycosyltransferase [Chloroflexota bacterium]